MRYFYIVCLSMILLSGCVSRTYPTLNNDYANEQWRSQIETDPDRWVQGADAWFLTGDPAVKRYKDQPETAAMTTMKIKASHFTEIQTQGSFQVQIFNTKGEPNSLYVYGPNEDVRGISVKMRGNLLCIEQMDPKANLCHVIVRIGLNELTRLKHQGAGSLEAVGMHSNHLVIDDNASGNSYIAGNMNLKQLNTVGSGTVTILGANTPVLDVIMRGQGSVNISGNVGLRSLNHEGKGNFNLVGANSDGITVTAKGSGKLGFYGHFNIKNVEARDQTCVLMMTSQSLSMYVNVYDQAKVGISGWTHDLTVSTENKGKFWGRYLQADNVYARASGQSHLNISGRHRVFASATDMASIYFFGDPAVLTPFVNGYGTIIPMWNNGSQYKDKYKDTVPITSFTTDPSYPHYQRGAKYRWNNGHLEKIS